MAYNDPVKTESRVWLAALLAVVLAASCLAQKPLSDDYIVDYVKVKLAEDSQVKGGALGVDVKNGIVTLSGTVPTQSIKQRAGKLAQSCRGVKQVVNNISVRK